MDIHGLTVGAFESNCFLLHDDHAADAIVVDPGGDAELIISTIVQKGLHPVLHLLTHGHVDHVSALAELVRRFPAPVAMHPGDRSWAFSPAAAMPPYYPAPEPPPGFDRDLADGQEWTDAGLTYDIIETPGHSPGGVCFYFPDHRVLIGGDTIFQGSIGRSDLPFANPEELWDSLQRIMQLPDETTIYPGHGPSTTIGRERAANPFLKDRSWVDYQG